MAADLAMPVVVLDGKFAVRVEDGFISLGTWPHMRAFLRVRMYALSRAWLAANGYDPAGASTVPALFRCIL